MLSAMADSASPRHRHARLQADERAAAGRALPLDSRAHGRTPVPVGIIYALHNITYTRHNTIGHIGLRHDIITIGLS